LLADVDLHALLAGAAGDQGEPIRCHRLLSLEPPRKATIPAYFPPGRTSRARRASHRWIARFSTPSAASFSPSHSVGCAWQMRPRSSALPPNSITLTASAINSLALGPKT